MFKDLKENFYQSGYAKISNYLSIKELQAYLYEYIRLISKADTIMRKAGYQNKILANIYKDRTNDLIVVSESNNAKKICRIENICACSTIIKKMIQTKISRLIKEIINKDVVIFKDKCNLKLPGGGSFSPHQDIAAYQHFKPSYFITVAVMLDAANIENGCLEMAKNYLEVVESHTGHKKINTPLGSYVVFDYYRGGPNNGNIKKEIVKDFVWEPISGKTGDIILFDSFVPHKSNKNCTDRKRRMFFFTFNLLEEGKHYHDYYKRKFQNFSDPIFHISTPTNHVENTS